MANKVYLHVDNIHGLLLYTVQCCMDLLVDTVEPLLWAATTTFASEMGPFKRDERNQ